MPRSTASSCSPCAPPASTAGRAAPRGRPNARTSHSSRPALKPRKRATAPASAAGPTSSARPIRKCRRSSERANGSRQAEEAPKLAELAASAGLSPYHFHRVFKALTGVTPKAYAAETRARRAADKLRTAETVTEAIYDAGFNSSSRFYENTDARLGMTPGAVRRGGAGAVIRFAVGEASLGAVLVAATDKGVCAILLGDDPDALVRDLQDRFPRAEFEGRRRGIRAHGRASGRSRRGARSATGSSARHPRHRVPAAGVGGAAAPSRRARRRPTRRSPARSASRKRCAPSRRPAAPIHLRSRFPAIAWCGRTATSPAIAGASSASAS